MEDPGLADAHLQLGMLCIDDGNSGAAVIELEEATGLRPADADTLYRWQALIAGGTILLRQSAS